MSERARELGADFLRYMKEAGDEWLESFKDSAVSHALTAIVAIFMYQVFRWIA